MKFTATKQNICMYKILIVEDETVIRSALRRLLERNSYKVSEAGAVKLKRWIEEHVLSTVV